MSENELLSQYRDVVSQPPQQGHILTTLDGSPVVLHVQLDHGKAPFIYARAYLSEILDQKLGWYARGEEDDKMIGWKCILMTRARRAVVARCGDQLDSGKILVKSLRVVRTSGSGKALLCEVHEFVEETVGTDVGTDANTDGELAPESSKGLIQVDGVLAEADAYANINGELPSSMESSGSIDEASGEKPEIS